MTDGLTGENPLRIAGCEIEQPGTGQMVVNNDIGLRKHHFSLAGQEPWIARARSDQIDLPPTGRSL
jgi:hypothetical protein